MHGPLLGEFMGTMVLVLLGDGVVANVLLKKSKGENSGWIVITTGWAMAVVAGIFTAIAFGSPGANINPAVTLAVAIMSGNWSNVGTFWIAQFLGGFAGAWEMLLGLVEIRDPANIMVQGFARQFYVWEYDFYIGAIGTIFLVVFGFYQWLTKSFFF